MMIKQNVKLNAVHCNKIALKTHVDCKQMIVKQIYRAQECNNLMAHSYWAHS